MEIKNLIDIRPKIYHARDMNNKLNIITINKLLLTKIIYKNPFLRVILI